MYVCSCLDCYEGAFGEFGFIKKMLIFKLKTPQKLLPAVVVLLSFREKKDRSDPVV